ncbi:MAG: twin-arginine translocase TatA/TatE family subunit [Planctomycetota bacterium]
MPTLGLFTSLGPLEIGIILLVGLLLFGRRLPEVGRGLGKSIVEFKRGLKDATDEIDEVSSEVRSPSQLKASESPASTPIQSAAHTEATPATQPASSEKATP